MKDIDFRYVCTSIANLAGMPIRLYRGGRQVFYYSVIKLIKDPLLAYEEEVLKIEESVGYFMTRHFNYYGIVNSGEYKIVLGPTRNAENSDSELKDLAFRIGVEQNDADMFVAGMKMIIRMPLETVLQTMCMINYILNGEKKSVEDVILYQTDDDATRELFSGNDMEMSVSQQTAPKTNVHNTIELENRLMEFISRGQPEEFKKWVNDIMPSVTGGTLAAEQLRHLKNTFIVTATLSARAAIRGGMDVDDALTLSDRYIQKCELIRDPLSVINEQYKMIFDYCRQVERVRGGRNPSKLVIAVTNYIQHHLSEPITAEQIAEHLFMSRGRFSVNFKEQSGVTPAAFIQQKKIEEAKRLLDVTDKTASAIAAYLGYSSPAHFAAVFKKYAGCTPAEYRTRHE